MWEVTALPQLGDGQFEGAGPGVPLARAVAVAVVDAFSLTCPYSLLQRTSASADMSASANVFTIARSRSRLAAARLSSASACRGRLSGAVIVLISFELRHLEDQPVAVHLCGHQTDAGANPRIRSNPYTASQDVTPLPASDARASIWKPSHLCMRRSQSPSLRFAVM
jgi:hypothetical protein